MKFSPSAPTSSLTMLVFPRSCMGDSSITPWKGKACSILVSCNLPCVLALTAWLPAAPKPMNLSDSEDEEPEPDSRMEIPANKVRAWLLWTSAPVLSFAPFAHSCFVCKGMQPEQIWTLTGVWHTWGTICTWCRGVVGPCTSFLSHKQWLSPNRWSCCPTCFSIATAFLLQVTSCCYASYVLLSQVKYVVGPGGTVIQNIQRKSKARIQVQKVSDRGGMDPMQNRCEETIRNDRALCISPCGACTQKRNRQNCRQIERVRMVPGFALLLWLPPSSLIG